MTLSNDDQKKIDHVTDALLGAHRQWIEDFAAGIDRDFETFMAELQDCLENGYSMHVGANETDVPDELWVHYEALRGLVKPEQKLNFWFSCAC